MTDGSSYELVLAPPAVRTIQSGLPEPVAAAVIEFLTGALVENPRRVGKPLRGGLAGIHSARRGTYRVLYRLNEERREVVVMRIDHRSDAYRPG
jgi:mRNA-degrading endonuclease RelE of RelBE toxin-antitoxin system